MSTKPADWERWIQKARDDLRWAQASFKEDVSHGVCFSSQQAVEKALKAFLLHQGKQPRRIHDLVALLEDCIEIDPRFEQLVDAAATLSGYYVETRYPDLGDFMGYTSDQAEEAIGMARETVTFVERAVGEQSENS